MSTTHDDTHDKPVDITIDDEPYSAPQKDMTPDQILGLAGLDPAKNYLVEKHGREQVSYKDKGGDVIKLHEHETFISVPLGDNTVS